MVTIAPSPDQTADLLHNMSLDSQPKTIEAPATTTKNGPCFSTAPPNGSAKPFSPSAAYLSNGFVPPTYYYGAYDGHGNIWNDYSMYVNADGSTAQNVYGDSYSCVIPQGYGYAPYGPYTPPTSPSPTMHHEGQLYGMQHYQYHSPYYQNHASSCGSSAPTNVDAPQGKFTTSVAADQLPLSYDKNKPSNSHAIHGNLVNVKNRFNPIIESPKDFSMSDNQENPSLPPCITLPGHPNLRDFSNGIQSQTLLYDGPASFSAVHRRGARAGVLPSMAYGENFPSWSDKSRHPPEFMNMQNTQPLPGLGLASGYMNEVFSGNRMYSRYGDQLRNGSGFASSGYGYMTNDRGWSTAAKHRPGEFGNPAVSYGKENFNALNELNKGPRSKGADHRNQKGMGHVNLLLYNLPANNDENVMSLIPNKEGLPGVDLSDNYENAKFFVIKSYSEDDVHKSIKYGVWSSTPNGNKKLNTAYLGAKEKLHACPIFLLFSVNASGQFVGLAEMVGPVDFDKTVEYWQQDKWHGCFPVKWHIIKDVPNGLLKHIILEYNENKPVTSSRDTQEVKLEQGMEIIKIFKSHSSKTSVLDDFGFYDSRQMTMQESKSRETQFRKQVVEGDLASVKQSGAETDWIAKGFGENELAEAADDSALVSELRAIPGRPVD